MDPTARRTCEYYKRPSWLATNFLVLFVLGLIVFGWVTFMRITFPFTYAISPSVAVSEAVVFNVLVALSLSSYFRVIFTDPGSVPDDVNNLVRIERKNGEFRRCLKCMHIKPDRAHHCSLCDTCTLKMDHHCPWTNNCIGQRNYKLFNLFVMHTAVLCLFNLFVSVPSVVISGFHKCNTALLGTVHSILHVWHFSTEFSFDEICVLVGCLIAVMFGITLGGFFATHLSMILKNQTTLEFYYDEQNPFDVGAKENFKQVFGLSPLLWFLPIRNELGDGLSFPIREDALNKTAETSRLVKRNPREGHVGLSNSDSDSDQIRLDLDSVDLETGNY